MSLEHTGHGCIIQHFTCILPKVHLQNVTDRAGIATSFSSRQRQVIFLFSRVSVRFWGHHILSSNSTGSLSLGVEGLGREADYAHRRSFTRSNFEVRLSSEWRTLLGLDVYLSELRI